LWIVVNVFVGNTPIGKSFSQAPQTLTASEFVQKVNSGNVTTATWQLDEITGKLADNSEYKVHVGSQSSQGAAELNRLLFSKPNIKFEIKSPPVSTGLMQILGALALPLMLVALFYLFVIRPAQQGGNQAMSFGRSKARRVGETGPKITFDDVAGVDEAKQELWEIVDFLKNTKKYAALGAKIPKGVLLTGPPGVGKTHLARAIAGEAGVPFFHISGSDFVEMFVGVGAARVRDLFETAKAHRPSLIFVDEIDAVGRQRGAGLGGGHDEREQTLNQLLVEMDGFDPNSGVILIAATNRPDVLDPALLRPGRFDRQVVVDAPDQVGREAILRIHAKGKPLDPNVDLEILSKRTPGFTGADLANTLNEGALLAARRGHARIAMGDLEEALDRVIAGPQRRSRIIDSKEKEIIAFHEAGHAVVGELLDHSDPVHKVTILPRGMSLGSTWQLPIADKYLVSKEELLDDIIGLLGGRVAEEIAFNTATTGASNDLERISAIARAMVTKYGMSERLGMLAIGKRRENPFLGRDYSEDRDYSDEIAKQIDEEVRAIVDMCQQRAKEILTMHRDKLDAVVAALLDRETLSREEFLAAMAGDPLPPPEFRSDEAMETDSGTAEASRPTRGKLAPNFEPGPA
ncbi:MAG: cell division protein FtsH, partial [Armatimonadota bacterium]